MILPVWKFTTERIQKRKNNGRELSKIDLESFQYFVWDLRLKSAVTVLSMILQFMS
jgi:hypothetical protein